MGLEGEGGESARVHDVAVGTSPPLSEGLEAAGTLSMRPPSRASLEQGRAPPR